MMVVDEVLTVLSTRGDAAGAAVRFVDGVAMAGDRLNELVAEPLPPARLAFISAYCLPSETLG